LEAFIESDNIGQRIHKEFAPACQIQKALTSALLGFFGS
jgi:hypothetical protein